MHTCPVISNYLKLLSLSWRQTYWYLVYISLISNFPYFTAVCDVAVAMPLYSYIDSIRNLFVIMSSSDSDFEVGENSCFGYQYEPEYTEEELAAAAATNEESTNNEENEAIDKNFCSCEHCALLPKQRECLCCKQFQHYDEHYITEDIPCISLHPDFDIICLNNTVLETAYVVFMRYKRLGIIIPVLMILRNLNNN